MGSKLSPRNLLSDDDFEDDKIHNHKIIIHIENSLLFPLFLGLERENREQQPNLVGILEIEVWRSGRNWGNWGEKIEEIKRV